MEPRIQYAKTSDGVNIAYWTLGEGPPLIHMPFVFSHVQLEWEFPECRGWYERLAERRQLVRYDWRGQGLSSRRIDDYSIEAFGRDIEAVADRLGFERFALLGLQHSGPAAIDYAARHPDRVSHLILWGSYTTAAEWLQSPRAQAVRATLSQDWDSYTEIVSHMLLGWSAGEQARRFAALIRQAIDREFLLNMIPVLNQFDVSASLSAVRSPTLVLHRRGFDFVDVGVARELAAGIPDARLVLLEGESNAPYLGDSDAAATAIDEFLGEGAAPDAREHTLPEGMTAILFADIAESTALTERMGDTAFRAKARELDGALRAVIREASGTPVEGKLLGDGVLAVFSSASQAIEAALACGKAGDNAGLPLHLGLHAGDVIRESDPDGRGNVYGGAVNIASRIAGLSAPGEVLVSDTVRSLARTSAVVAFEDRGGHTLKGVADPHHLFAVSTRGNP